MTVTCSMPLESTQGLRWSVLFLDNKPGHCWAVTFGGYGL